MRASSSCLQDQPSVLLQHETTKVSDASLRRLEAPEALHAEVEIWTRRKHGQVIPQILHQSWRTCRLPTVAEAWREQTAKALLPSWKMWLWTDQDNRAFIEKEFPSFLPLFDGYDVAIKRIDAVRYFYLYRYGGVYMDLDSMSLRPFEELPLANGEAIFGFSHANLHCHDGSCIPSYSEAVPNALMASPPGHPFFAFIIHRLNHTASRKRVIEATGPVFLSASLRRWATHRFGSTTIHPTPRLFNTISNSYAHKWHPCGIATRNPMNERRRNELSKCAQKLPNSIATTFWTSSWAGRLTGSKGMAMGNSSGLNQGNSNGLNQSNSRPAYGSGSLMDWCGVGGLVRCPND